MRKAHLKTLDQAAEMEIDEQEPEVEIDDAGRPLKESKLNNLLSFLKTYENDYEIWLYKKGERNKKFLLFKYDNYIPDPFTDIQQKFGGGEYIMMVRSKNELIDSAGFNLMELTAATAPTSQLGNFPGSSRSDMLNELKIMAELFKGDNSGAGKNDNNVMLEITKMQLEQSRHMAEQQQKSEARITALIMEMQSKKPALSEIMEVVSFVDELKGGAAAAGEASLIEKIISSPIAQPIIEKLLSGFNVGAPPAAIAAQSAPTQIQPARIPEPVKKMTAAEYVSKIPEDFKKQVKPETAANLAQFIFEKNKNMIDFQTAENIINIIVEENLKNELIS